MTAARVTKAKTQVNKHRKADPDKLPADMTFEEILDEREKLVYLKEELEAAVKVFSEELLTRLNEEKVNGKVIGNRSISKTTRVSFKTTIEEARTLGAIKEAVDSEVLKKLYYSNKVKVPGVSISQYVTVREVVKTEEA